MLETFRQFTNRVADLSAEEALTMMGAFAKVVHIPKKEHWFMEGQRTDEVAFVLRGLLRSYYIKPNGEDLTANFFFAPVITGDITANITQQPTRLNFQALEDTDWKHEQSTYGHITASVGVASILPSDNTSPLALLKAGDEALYLAKAQGRNQAVLSTWRIEADQQE